MNEFILGLDLGQMQDYTAIAIMQRFGETKMNAIYHLRYLERLKLGTSYPEVVRRVKELIDNEPLLDNTHLVADATGVGIAVIDILKEAKLLPIPVSITNGEMVTSNGLYWKVPKRELVSQLQVLFQLGNLKIAESLPEATTLVQELMSFKVKITENANDTYGSWREGTHDDLVLAVALAAWWGQRALSSGEPAVEAFVF